MSPVSVPANTGQPNLVDFEHRVAGHDGIKCTSDNKMLTKPFDQRESTFYEKAMENKLFKQFIPEYFGTIFTNDGSEDSLTPHICIENLLSEFVVPCIADIKIGTQLHDLDASPEKKAKMIQRAKEKTSAEIGYALCGMGIPRKQKETRDWFLNLNKQTVITDGLIPFFQVAENNVNTEYMIEVIHYLAENISNYMSVIERSETRMYGSSLLVIYESDPERVKTGRGRLFDVRAIDFAHSHWLPGEGSDEQYLFGLNNLVQTLNVMCKNFN